jgi:hypothetical protein
MNVERIVADFETSRLEKRRRAASLPDAEMRVRALPVVRRHLAPVLGVEAAR